MVWQSFDKCFCFHFLTFGIKFNWHHKLINMGWNNLMWTNFTIVKSVRFFQHLILFVHPPYVSQAILKNWVIPSNNLSFSLRIYCFFLKPNLFQPSGWNLLLEINFVRHQYCIHLCTSKVSAFHKWGFGSIHINNCKDSKSKILKITNWIFPSIKMAWLITLGTTLWPIRMVVLAQSFSKTPKGIKIF